ncbi:cytochrome P450 6A1 [Polyplosphaeria fusca]|uniref:Cytochrome P450 6A1 n=1 Tax=Polyplosphaeria fusca TaxID=682080 RepID=A0A9P4QX06_9PLEO|nr:cytochrome P450 6A1 [Polyplosphaeria fusca]
MSVFDSLENVTRSPVLLLGVSSALLFAVYILYTTFSRRIPSNAPQTVRGNFPITGAFGFWANRWDFFRHARDHSPTGSFTWNAGPNTIIGLSGDHGRRLFFESKQLGFSEGYAVMFGSAPRVEAHDDGQGVEDELSNHFHRRITYLLKTEQFRKKLPTLISDVQEAIEAIKNDPSGMTNPFESIYRIVFRLTIRMVGAEEIAEDPKMLEQTLKYFEMIDKSATASAVMFPKLPSPALIKRYYAGAKLFMQIESIVKKRAATDEKHDDALQYMLDSGDRMFRIIEFILGALFAGLLNSGINAAWVLCYLATSPDWLGKCRDEIRTTAAKYATNPNAPLRHQLDDVPLEAWESEFPVVDMCLRDSIRLNLLGTAFRKNVSGRDIEIGDGKVIPPETFVTYALADVHHDPNVYPNPDRWDPSRYMAEKAEDKKKQYGFLGWGVARHPCLGMRFAKLEQNIITAYFLASFDFELVDKLGASIAKPPQVNINGHSAHKPTPAQFLKLRQREK